VKAPHLVKARIKGKHFREMQEGDIVCLSFGDERARNITFKVKAFGADYLKLERWGK